MINAKYEISNKLYMKKRSCLDEKKNFQNNRSKVRKYAKT